MARGDFVRENTLGIEGGKKVLFSLFLPPKVQEVCVTLLYDTLQLLHSISFASEEKSQIHKERSQGSVVSHSLLCHEKEVDATLMRGTTELLPGKNVLKHMNPLRRTWGALTTTSVQKKQGNNEFGESERPNADDKIEPIVAFSKPPPLPPVLGPFVVFSLLEMGSDHDGNDN